MYCNYTYVAGASASDIKNDLIKLVTADANTASDTLLTSLSTSCDKTLTDITKTTAQLSGWSTVAGGNLDILVTTLVDSSSASINMPSSLRWVDCTYYSDSSEYFLVGKATTSGANTNIIYKTKDFITFTPITLPVSASWRRIVQTPYHLVVYAGGDESTSEADTVYCYSNDVGVSWQTSYFTQTTNPKYYVVGLDKTLTPNTRKYILMGNMSASYYGHYINSAPGIPHIFTSSTGTSWTLLPTTGTACGTPTATTPGLAGTAGVPQADYYSNIAVLTEAQTGTPITPVYMSIGGNNGVYATQSNKIIVSNTSGTSWYQHNTPSAAGSTGTALTSNWAGVAAGDGIFVVVQGGQGATVFGGSNQITKAYFHVYDANTTVTGTQTWVASTLPTGVSNISTITYHKGYFVILPSGDTVTSSVMFVGKYNSVGNSLVWEEKSLDHASNWSRAYSNPVTRDLILLAGSRISVNYPTSTGSKVRLSDSVVYDEHIKASNITTSNIASYKYANIAVANGGITLRVAEKFTGKAITNLAYESDSSKYMQLLDLDNGGVIFVSCSARHLALLSYLPTSGDFGSVSGSFCGVFEYTRDDAWSSSSIVNNPTDVSKQYPSHAFFSPSSGLVVKVPRLKIGISSPDVTGSSAQLSLSTGIALSKRILNSSGTGLAHIASDIRANNATDFSYAVLGGVLQGIKETTDSQGNSLEEAVLDGVTYIIWEGAGTYPATKKLRFLFAKV